MYATQLDAYQRFAFVRKLTKTDLWTTCHVIKIFIIFLSFHKYDLHKYMKKLKIKLSILNIVDTYLLCIR